MTDNAKCYGCGKTFKGARGLAAHQNSRHVALDCKPMPAACYAALVEKEGMQAESDALREANLVDPELISARPAPVLGLLSGRPVAFGVPPWDDQFDDGGPVTSVGDMAAGTGDPQPELTPEQRDALLGAARRYGFLQEWPTILVKIEGRDRWAIRYHADDARAIAKTATSAAFVRATKHGDGTETHVTDYSWDDGLRIRMTETLGN